VDKVIVFLMDVFGQNGLYQIVVNSLIWISLLVAIRLFIGFIITPKNSARGLRKQMFKVSQEEHENNMDTALMEAELDLLMYEIKEKG
jgi:hypothetical protein